MLILGIESSCDDTCAAIVTDETQVFANIISSQFDIHSKYGGIVPELASRKHIESIWPVVKTALEGAEISLDKIDLIAATRGPGLIGSLLVGFTFAKALALACKVPFIGVDHMAGHLLSVFLCETKPAFPYIALIVSGGNSSLFKVTSTIEFEQIGRTRDDAAGEAFDKVAKMMELGYPGGPLISRSAEKGNPDAIKFPRAWLEPDSFDFSFSGLKTSVANHINTCRQKDIPLDIADTCASFQEAVVDVLIEKSIKATREHRCSTLVLGGGVASNKRLRESMQERCLAEDIRFLVPQPIFCTDNAAMIGLAGYYKFLKGQTMGLETDVYARSPLN